MKTLTMTQFRAEPGERITDIVRDRASFLLTKGDKPVAKLTPIDDTTEILPDGVVKGELPLTFRRPLGTEY